MSESESQEPKKAVIPAASAESLALHRALSGLDEDEMLTYEQLSTIAHGEDVQHEKRHYLTTAVSRCLNDGIVIGCVHKVGMRRLKNNEIDSVADEAQATMRRKARKTKKALVSCRYDELTDQEKVRHGARLAFIGAVALFTKSKSVKQLEDSAASAGVTPAPAPFDPEKTFKLFMPPKKRNGDEP